MPPAVDQTAFMNVLSALKELFLPEISDGDVHCLESVIQMLDTVILAGLHDPDNWVLAPEFAETPFVKTSLASGVPLQVVLGTVFQGIRTYIWMYLEDLRDYVPNLLELEEALADIDAAVGTPKS